MTFFGREFVNSEKFVCEFVNWKVTGVASCLVGKANKGNDKARPITIKFAKYPVRNVVYKNKENLKCKWFLITESLTENRLKTPKSAQIKYGMTNVWTRNGRSFFNVNNKVHKF